MFRSKTRLMLLIFIVAFLIRLLAVFALRDIHAGPTRAFGADGIEFNELAYQVSVGHGYVLQPGHPTSFRAPGFPLFLAGVYFLAGRIYPLVYAIFCALGAMACVLTFLVASELLGPGRGLIAAAFAAIYASSVYDATVFASENLFVVCLGLCVWLFLRYLKNGSLWELFFSALSMGWGILTRPFALLLIPLFVSVLLWRMWKTRKILLVQFVLLAVTPLAVVARFTVAITIACCESPLTMAAGSAQQNCLTGIWLMLPQTKSLMTRRNGASACTGSKSIWSRCHGCVSTNWFACRFLIFHRQTGNMSCSS